MDVFLLQPENIGPEVDAAAVSPEVVQPEEKVDAGPLHHRQTHGQKRTPHLYRDDVNASEDPGRTNTCGDAG
eukprot:CAMPEP_0180322910 /NCGR_PEP_ID=MMETSP0988-20121125/37010_1 /TAXON_ID=697907 /ORGANISM="non described non described, Strain CCMP2293" /LENGTH=71 /DNA_ID=CAMNT_0022309039 /DNA_START=113 /DNA_END=324 /DNA_ORIENTATION=-